MLISTEGDIGDIIYLCCILKQLQGGPHKLLLQASDATKAKGEEGVNNLFAAVGELVNAQPYIQECRIVTPEDPIDWPSGQFRAQHYIRGRTLMEAHLVHLIRTKGIGREITGESQWLTVPQSTEANGRVVINRTGRYRNAMFPWKAIVAHYRHRLLFVGYQHEWREFIAHFGYVPWRPTKNLMEMATVISGCDIFIGNQSCANALAEGMKRPLIQETSTVFPDCIYLRENAQHVYDGGCTLPDIAGSGKLKIKANTDDLERISTATAPPGMWQYPGLMPSPQIGVLVRSGATLDELKDLSEPERRQRILIYNIDRCPDWQKSKVHTRVLAAIEGIKRRSKVVSPASDSQHRVPPRPMTGKPLVLKKPVRSPA